MEITTLLSRQILSMGIMLVIAFALCKCGVLKTEHNKILSAISVYVATPAIILHAFMQEYTPERAKGLLLAVILTTSTEFLWIGVSYLLGKPLKIDKIERANMVFFNGGLAMPIVQAALGTEAVFFCCAHSFSQNILIWTYGLISISGNKHISVKKILTSLPMISVGVGLIIFFSRVKMPELVTSTVDQLFNINGPLVMCIAGLILAGADLKACVGRLRNYLTVFGRLIFMPCLFIGVVALTGITKTIPYARDVCYPLAIAFSTPPATTITILASLYSTKADAEESSTLNVMCVIFCLLTIPLISVIFQFMCPA